MKIEDSIIQKIPDARKLLKVCRKFAKKIAPAYVLFDWKWAGVGGNGVGIPNEDEIYNTILYLINEIPFDDNKEHEHSTGGIVVKLCIGEEDNIKWFELVFEFNDILEQTWPIWPIENFKKVLSKYRLIRIED